MKKKKRAFGYRRLPTVFLFVLFAAAIGFMIHDGFLKPAKETRRDRVDNDRTVREVGKEPKGAKKDSPSGRIRRIAIIVDDIGYDLSAVNELLKLDVPLTFAILPYCPHSAEAARRIHGAGREILLHIPMEPLDYPEKNPGQGVLFVRMNDEELRQTLEGALAAVPWASGANNHMGSKFMRHGDKLAVVFRTLRERGLFFVDSLTTENSAGRDAARETGIPFVSRDVFMDNNRDAGRTRAELMKHIGGTGTGKKLIVIGHPYPETITAIRESIRQLRDAGVTIVPVSQLVKSHKEGER